MKKYIFDISVWKRGDIVVEAKSLEEASEIFNREFGEYGEESLIDELNSPVGGFDINGVEKIK